jgi:hypothetical protein
LAFNLSEGLFIEVYILGSIYSSRPLKAVADIAVLKGLNFGVSVYGDLWRRQRKTIMESVGAECTAAWKLVQDAEATQMIYDLLNAREV